ncbi:hypothetical protein D3C76_731960 [compost metagenome]
MLAQLVESHRNTVLPQVARRRTDHAVGSAEQLSDQFGVGQLPGQSNDHILPLLEQVRVALGERQLKVHFRVELAIAGGQGCK